MGATDGVTDLLLVGDKDGLSMSQTWRVSSLRLARLALGSLFFTGEESRLPVGLGNLLVSPSGKCREQTLMWDLTSSSLISNTSSHTPHLTLSLGKR